MKILQQYNEIAKKKGILLTDLKINSYAFNRTDTLEAIDALEQDGMAILGGDVLVAQEGKWKWGYTNNNWYCNPQPDEVAKFYIKRCADVARDYVKNYNETRDKKYIYNLIFSEVFGKQADK